MKKKLLIISLLLLGVTITYAQSYNPYVNQGIISPAPLLPLEFNGTGVASFNIGNTGSTDITVVPGQLMGLTISLSKGIPNNVDPIAALGGTWKTKFSWTYNPSITSYQGTQIATIPGSTPGNPSQGNITIDYKVTENAPIGNANNGFNVNLQPPGYTNPQTTDDDKASSYTFVRAYDYGDAPASYGAAQHEINVFKTSGLYTQYVHLGASVTADPGNLSSANADADIDNGVIFPRMIVGTTVTIPVVVTTNNANFGLYGLLNGWIDWNGDGDFADSGENIVVNQFVTTSGTTNYSVTVPANANILAPTFARFRIGSTTTSSGNDTYGEVEDYKILLENNVCAWRTINSGNWTDPLIWEYFDCTANTWKTTTVSPNNDRPIYVLHNVTIQPTDVITADSLYIQPDGKLNACGSLTIDNEIAFVLDATGNPGELNNCGCPGGTVELNPTARKIVHRPAGSAWSFMSFPFDVYEENIFLSGTKVYDPLTLVDNFSYKTATPATWGNLTQTGKDFYAVEHDGQKQANENAVPVIPATSDFVDVNDTKNSKRVLEAVKGYLISNASSRLRAIDFTSELGEDFNFCTDVTKSLTYYTPVTGTGTDCGKGWNFVGLPYVSSYNLNDATTPGTMQVYQPQIPNYVTIAPQDDKTLYPFSAFFVQVFATSTNIIYDTEGQQRIKGVSRAVNFDEISLELMYGTKVDRTRIRLQEDAVDNFVYTEDAYKMMSPSATYPQIYTQIEGACTNISINALPENTGQVELKIRTGVNGFYTIRLTDAEKAAGLSKVILVDRETGLRTDLMTVEGYEFEVTTTGVSDRFYVLMSNDQTTQANHIGNNGISINTKGKHVTISGLKGTAQVNMFDVVGKLIYQYPDIKDEQSFDVDIPGVYMMDISTETQKARIKVLINKKN